MRRYSEAVKADVRRRMGQPMRQSVARISKELGIHIVTLYTGLIQSLSQGLLSGLSAWVEVGGIASSLCLKAPTPQPIST